jgi:hypothetical protein
MGFNDKFAVLVRFGSGPFSNSGRAGFARDGCCGAWDFGALLAPAPRAIVTGPFPHHESARIDIGDLNHFAPFRDFISDKRAKVGG